MRKFIQAILVCVLCLSLIGCSSVDNPPATTDITNEPEAVENPSTDPASTPTQGSVQEAGKDPGTEAESIVDECGNQAGNATVDLNKAVSKAYAEENLSYSAMMRITINPYLLLYLDTNGVVLAYSYENKDAAAAYKDVCFTGNTVKDAIKTMVDSALETDYLKPAADMIIEVAEVKDTAFQVNETLYIAEVTANKTLRQNNTHAEVGVAMPPEVEKIAEIQGEFVLNDLSVPQDVQYLTDMLDYSAKMKIGENDSVVLFLDDAGIVMAYSYETLANEQPPGLPSPVGQNASDAIKTVTNGMIETSVITDDTSLKVEVSESFDAYFFTDEFTSGTKESIKEIFEENDMTADIDVTVTAEPPREEELPSSGDDRPGENSSEDICETCHGTKAILCNKCDENGEFPCDLCNGEGRFTCEVCNGSTKVLCGKCNGSGYDPDPCRFCGGTGKCQECGGSGTEISGLGDVVPCHRCNGDGYCGNMGVCYTGHGPCPGCDMTGYSNCHGCQGTGTQECYTCQGDGKMSCPDCNGRKRVPCPDCE